MKQEGSEMPNEKGLPYLKLRLNQKRIRVLKRYRFYELKNWSRDFGISTPPGLENYQSVLGWCGKAVDSLADRLQFYAFKEDNFGLNEIYEMNNSDTLFDSAILSALIGSCAFMYISPDEEGYPRLQVIDGSDATGDLDPVTGLLTEGYAVLERNDYGTPIKEAYFRAADTSFYENEKLYRVDPNPAPYPLLVPIVFRPDAKRPFGHSRISRACMSLVESALRTVKRSEISAEFYSFPQKYIVGTDADREPMDKWKASMSALIEITKSEDNTNPQFGQFSQQSMEPHISQLKMFASLFAGETGLTLDDLGFTTDNPSSVEAIKAAHENLRLTARKAQRKFGSGFLNAGYLAACVRDNYPYLRQQFRLTKPTWEPVFEPDGAAMGLIGDGAIKMNQAIPGYFGKDNVRELLGIDPSKEPVPVITEG